MGAASNVTYLTFDGHVELHKYKYLYFLIMLLVFVLIICSNLSIFCIILLHRELHKPMYVFIAALLINSIPFSLNVYPKLLSDFLSDKQVISYGACVLQGFVFYSLSCSEFLLLSVMAYDRYVSICKPLQYPTIMRRASIITLLVCAWLVPALFFGLHVIVSVKRNICQLTVKAIFCNNAFSNVFCVNSLGVAIFGMFILVTVGLCPLVFILFSYAKIIVVTFHSSGKVRVKAVQTCFPHLMVLMNYSVLIVYNAIVIKVESRLPVTVDFLLTIQVLAYHPLSNPVIYGLKMKEIHKHLKGIFKKKKKT